MKLQLKKNSPVKNSPWRIDFKRAENLPDIKVIRTSFFLNAISFILPAIIIIFWAQAEITLSGVNEELSRLSEEQNSKVGGDRQLVKLSSSFDAEVGKIQSLEQYKFNLFEGSEFILAVSQCSSGNIILNSIKVDKTARVSGGKVKKVVNVWESALTGYVVEAGVEATSVVNGFVETIKQQELWAELIEDVFVENLTRDATTGALNFKVRMTFVKPEGEAK